MPRHGEMKKGTSKKRLPTPPAPSSSLEDVYEAGRILAWQMKGAAPASFKISPANTTFAARFKVPRGGDWWSLLHPLDRGRLRRGLQRLNADSLPALFEFRVTDAFGSAPWVRLTVRQITGTGTSRVMTGFLQDIQAEKEFQLESLRVSEREQNRIGQDLHDDLCQVLAGVSCLIRVTESKLQKSAPEEVPFLREINQQVIDAMQRTRALTHGLFPSKVQISDVRGALLELASQLRARFGIEVKTEFSGRFPKHSSGQIIQLFRIAQEASSNAIKHGAATHITIHLEPHEEEMTLTITDNGTGLGKATHAPGVGLQIMEFRAGILGGELKVANAQPNGVCVCLSYPFDT